RDSRRRLPPGIYGVRRLRCLSRRRLRMLRPPFVRMRARKPCVRARLRFFGWYVRFMRSRSLASAFCFPAICEVAAEWRFVRGDAVREQLYARPRRGQPDGLAPAPARSSPHQAVPPGPLARVKSALPRDLETTWHNMRDAMRGEVTDFIFHVWIEPLQPAGLVGDTVYVAAPSHVRGWVRGRYGDLLQSAARTVIGRAARVDPVSDDLAPPAER